MLHPAMRLQHAGIGGLLDQRVAEVVDRLLGMRSADQEVRALKPRERRQHLRLLAVEHRRDDRGPDLARHGGGRLQHVLVGGQQPVQARGDDAAHRVGQVELVDLDEQAIGPALADQRALLEQRGDAFLDEERIAAGALDQQPREAVIAGIIAEQLAHQFECLGRRQRLDRQAAHGGRPDVAELRTMVHQQHLPRRGQALGDAVEHRERLAIRPVQVGHREHERAFLRKAGEQVGEGRVQPALPLVGCEAPPGRILRTRAQRRDHGGHGIRGEGAEARQPAFHLVVHPGRAILRRHAEMRPRKARERRERRRAVIALAEGLQDARGLGRLARDEFLHQARLAAASIAHERHTRPVPVQAAAQRILEHRHLGGTADEGRLAAPRADLQARARGVRRDQAIDLDRVGRSAQVQHAWRVRGDVALDQSQRGGGDPGLARLCRLLDPCRDVHHRAGGIEPAREVVDDVVHHDLARMQADARREVDAVPRAFLLREAPQRVAHVQCRAAGGQRVLLHRRGCAEHRHHAIAEHAADGTPEAMHRLDHGLGGRAQQFARALGVLAVDQPRRAADVGEQDRERLAFLVRRGPRWVEPQAAGMAEQRPGNHGGHASRAAGMLFHSRHA